MAQWIGAPKIKGSTESMRMALLTASLIGLQYVHACLPLATYIR
jgi:solute carrier family 45 protein 1/2/4